MQLKQRSVHTQVRPFPFKCWFMRLLCGRSLPPPATTATSFGNNDSEKTPRTKPACRTDGTQESLTHPLKCIASCVPLHEQTKYKYNEDTIRVHPRYFPSPLMRRRVVKCGWRGILLTESSALILLFSQFMTLFLMFTAGLQSRRVVITGRLLWNLSFSYP